MLECDLLIVGAGPVGCVIAERAANLMGWKSVIIDRRNHPAGNCHDETHSSGVFIHKYGPHYFRTNKQEILDYLSRFTEWIEGNYIVKSSQKGELYPFPINLETLEKFFKKKLTPQTAQELIESLRDKNIQSPQNSEEFVLSRVGRQLYEAFYLGYTLKQWSQHPKDLEASVCGRIPIRFNYDDKYVDHKFKVTPKLGFTEMFKKMIQHPKIELKLNTQFKDVRSQVHPKVATVYCGPIDEYFEFKLGHLAWRSLEFDFKVYNKEFHQPCVQINYPNEFDYTRSVEIKHVTQQKTSNTVVSYEYPQAKGDPYYPIPAAQNRTLYSKYADLAQHEQKTNRVFFAGRLARYLYINTDEAIEMGLEVFNEIRKTSAA